jgi:hypothetical protein
MDEDAEAAKTVRAFGDRNSALNDLREAKMTEAEMRKQNLEARAAAAEAEAAQALETGDWQKHASQQRAMSELAVARARVADEQRYWASRPIYAVDPVAALLQAKASEPETVRWLKANPLDAAVLATGSDPARAGQIQAAHHAALAEHHVAGSREYFHCVDKVLAGTGKTTRASGGGTPGGGAEVRLTQGEVQQATDGTLVWNTSDPTGQNRWRKGDPIGTVEMARRKKALTEQGAYIRLD